MKILQCSCASTYQDKLYGAGKRAHTQTRKSNGTTYRCTSCERENVLKSADKPAK